ncbi:hypothetical protein OE88DRAFT_370367 [Heliocybe sulcata]|uniref:Uncharacterized protein n=1 Tax=Heliocybe sulcata TaxID=5364 RepID=A0A5C3MXE5_9AGAM|nr:hypothetical protein OE88DRAFT_370367 [Heliocybe sulcata]
MATSLAAWMADAVRHIKLALADAWVSRQTSVFYPQRDCVSTDQSCPSCGAHIPVLGTPVDHVRRTLQCHVDFAEKIGTLVPPNR